MGRYCWLQIVWYRCLLSPRAGGESLAQQVSSQLHALNRCRYHGDNRIACGAEAAITFRSLICDGDGEREDDTRQTCGAEEISPPLVSFTGMESAAMTRMHVL